MTVLGKGRVAVFGHERGKPARFGLAVLDAGTGKAIARYRYGGTDLKGVVAAWLDADGSLVVGGGKTIARLEVPAN